MRVPYPLLRAGTERYEVVWRQIGWRFDRERAWVPVYATRPASVRRVA